MNASKNPRKLYANDPDRQGLDIVAKCIPTRYGVIGRDRAIRRLPANCEVGGIAALGPARRPASLGALQMPALAIVSL